MINLLSIKGWREKLTMNPEELLTFFNVKINHNEFIDSFIKYYSETTETSHVKYYREHKIVREYNSFNYFFDINLLYLFSIYLRDCLGNPYIDDKFNDDLDKNMLNCILEWFKEKFNENDLLTTDEFRFTDSEYLAVMGLKLSLIKKLKESMGMEIRKSEYTSVPADDPF